MHFFDCLAGHYFLHIILLPLNKLPLPFTPVTPLPSWQLNSYLNLPPLKNTPSFLHHFTPWQLNFELVLPPIPPCTIYPLPITPFYPLWQLNSYLLLPPLNKYPHTNLVSGGISSKVLPLQPNTAQSYMAILVREVLHRKSSHCSSLQPTLTILVGGGREGGNSSKVPPLQPNSYIILPPLNKLPPHSYINVPLIDKSPLTLTTKWEDFWEEIRPGW